MKSKLSSLFFATLLTLAGCSNGSAIQPEQTGGHGGSGSGGQSQTGGNSGGGKGGASGLGGTIGNGGSAVGGGTSASGGSGGASETGGKIGSGGAGNGGAAGNGGSSSTGGEWAIGGIGVGGLSAKGGVAGSGGIASTGGVPGSGGVGATGGSSTKDGGAGGVAGTGGTTVPITASGYPAAGPNGQAKPSGTGTTVTVLAWAGFKSAVSFTFDDTNSSQISNYPALQALNDKGNNVRYTFYMQTGKTTEMGSSVWPQVVKDGHELGNHTKSHSPPASTSDIQAAEDTVKSMFGVTAYSFAAPNGDSSYVTAIPTMKEFLTNRTAGNGGGIAMTDNPSSRQYALPCIIPATGAQTSAMTSSISSGTSGGKWNTFLVHGFTGGTDGAYQPVDIAQFTGAVKWAKDQGNIWIDTVGNVSAYWIAGYKFAGLTATTAGTDKTWTWKTSDFSNPFPTGHYLRVTTDGGVLKQGSTVLPWDDHGYYEVSLDAGTLTLSAQ